MITPYYRRVDEWQAPSFYYGSKTMGFISRDSLKRFGKRLRKFVKNVGNFIKDTVAGLWDAVSKAWEQLKQTVSDIVEFVKTFAKALVGKVKWNEVFRSLGKIFRGIANIMVILNPIRIAADILQKSELTAHAFRELNRLTGGMLTTFVNISDLVWRAARGDAITKEELLKDALFIFQVAAIVAGGPLALGAFVGGIVGREACAKAKDVKEACQIALMIAGAAAGGYLADAYNFNWVPPKDAALSTSAKEITKKSFTDYISPAANKVLENKIGEKTGLLATQMCNNQSWAGKNECSILGNIAAEYVNAPPGTKWPEFLASSAAKIGATELMRQWFPENSPERKAIEYQIKYETLPGEQITEVKKANLLPLFALAGAGAALLMVGA